MKKKWLPTLWITLSLYGVGILSSVALAHWVKQNPEQFRMSFEDTLEEFRKSESAFLPTVLEEDLRMDRIVTGPENVYETHYTWLVLPEDDLTWLGHVLHDHWANHYKNSEDMRFLRSLGTRLRQVYHDTEGNVLLTVDVEAPTSPNP